MVVTCIMIIVPGPSGINSRGKGGRKGGVQATTLVYFVGCCPVWPWSLLLSGLGRSVWFLASALRKRSIGSRDIGPGNLFFGSGFLFAMPVAGFALGRLDSSGCERPGRLPSQHQRKQDKSTLRVGAWAAARGKGFLGTRARA